MCETLKERRVITKSHAADETSDTVAAKAHKIDTRQTITVDNRNHTNEFTYTPQDSRKCIK